MNPDPRKLLLYLQIRLVEVQPYRGLTAYLKIRAIYLVSSKTWQVSVPKTLRLGESSPTILVYSIRQTNLFYNLNPIFSIHVCSLETISDVTFNTKTLLVAIKSNHLSEASTRK